MSKLTPAKRFLQFISDSRLYLLYALPATLFFSYYPVISLGTTSSMNLELSLPLIWLVLFFCTSLPDLSKFIRSHYQKLLIFTAFPIYTTLSVFWSANRFRTILTAGILWLIFFAILSIYQLSQSKSVVKNTTIKHHLLKVFFISSAVICLWCWLQAILDVVQVSRDLTLMCQGCTYQAFGFPHPNGFAVEPQFMGNLLLAPSLLALYLYFCKDPKHPKLLAFTALLFITTLFFTFSRGAIFSFLLTVCVVAIIFIRKIKSPRPLLILPMLLIPFILALTAQGIFAALSPTNDTFLAGTTKSLHHLSLGTIDLRHLAGKTSLPPSTSLLSETEPHEDSPTTPSDSSSNSETNSAHFSGYVAESTNIRRQLTFLALNLWTSNLSYFFFGVGLGSAGVSLHQAYPQVLGAKEIVQNQYASLALETGLLGLILLAITIIQIIKKLRLSRDWLLFLSLILAYALSLLFFSGLPNALHVYLLPPLTKFISDRRSTRTKTL